MAFERLKHFLDTFGEPRPPKPPLIPERYRVPVLVGMAVVSLVALLLLVRFVVIPGIEAQRGLESSSSVPSSVREKTL